MVLCPQVMLEAIEWIGLLCLGLLGWYSIRNWPAKRLLALAAILMAVSLCLTIARAVLMVKHFMLPLKSTEKIVAWTTIKTHVKPYERDGKLFCRMPETGREVNLTDFTFRALTARQIGSRGGNAKTASRKRSRNNSPERIITKP